MEPTETIFRRFLFYFSFINRWVGGWKPSHVLGRPSEQVFFSTKKENRMVRICFTRNIVQRFSGGEKFYHSPVDDKFFFHSSSIFSSLSFHIALLLWAMVSKSLFFLSFAILLSFESFTGEGKKSKLNKLARKGSSASEFACSSFNKKKIFKVKNKMFAKKCFLHFLRHKRWMDMVKAERNCPMATGWKMIPFYQCLITTVFLSLSGRLRNF